jgi:hypothetical protein
MLTLSSLMIKYRPKYMQIYLYYTYNKLTNIFLINAYIYIELTYMYLLNSIYWISEK